MKIYVILHLLFFVVTDYSGLVPELLKATGKGKSVGDIEIDDQSGSTFSPGGLVPHELKKDVYDC